MNRREFMLAAGALGGAALFPKTSAAAIPAVEAGEADVIVAGGGPAGLATAVTFARLGKKVRLFEAHGALGGIWTTGLLSCIIDFDRSPLTKEITARLDKLGARVPRREKMLDSNYLYEPEYMKFICEELCREAGVVFQLHTSVVAVEKSGRDITAVFTESKSGRQRWRAPLFVDATGDGDLAARAGCGFDCGGANPGDPDQPASLIAMAYAEDDAPLARFTVNDPCVFGPAGQTLFNAKKEFLLELRRVGVEPSYSAPTLFRLRPHLYAIMANHEYGVAVDDAAAQTAATVRARRELMLMAMALVGKGGKAWQGFRLLATAEQLGNRGARRIHGRYKLTREDVLAGAQFPDAVAECGFCMDIHTTRYAERKDGVVVTAPAAPRGRVQPVYQIPLRACQAADVNNLYMVGRCISGDFAAQSSYRITGAAVGMGEGLAKALVRI